MIVFLDTQPIRPMLGVALSQALGFVGTIGIIFAILSFLAWWLLIETEGVYLGRRVVIWLYDLYADRYDRIKDFQPIYDHVLLVQPIMGLIAPHEAPLVLDVATGTGRLPDTMLDHTHFHGRIIGVDLSYKMLAVAAEKLRDDQGRISLLRCPAEHLPFDDNTFDVITCLEALEFMQHPREVISELARVLRPGGVLLITNRINTRWMPGKVFTDAQLITVLSACRIEDVEVEPWQSDYHRVWGMKTGDSLPAGPRPLLEVLRCPMCGANFDETLRCKGCLGKALVGQGGVIDLMPLYSGNR